MENESLGQLANFSNNKTKTKNLITRRRSSVWVKNSHSLFQIWRFTDWCLCWVKYSLRFIVLFLRFVIFLCGRQPKPCPCYVSCSGLKCFNCNLLRRWHCFPFSAWFENAMPTTVGPGVTSLLTLHRRWLFSLWRPGLYSQPLRFACSPRWWLVKLVSKPPLPQWVTGALDWSDIPARLQSWGLSFR